eukprot:1582352-Rhodomonas_salina.2
MLSHSCAKFDGACQCRFGEKLAHAKRLKFFSITLCHHGVQRMQAGRARQSAGKEMRDQRTNNKRGDEGLTVTVLPNKA